MDNSTSFRGCSNSVDGAATARRNAVARSNAWAKRCPGRLDKACRITCSAASGKSVRFERGDGGES